MKKRPSNTSLIRRLQALRTWPRLILALALLTLIGSGFAVVRASAGERFPWPERLSRIYGHSDRNYTFTNVAVAHAIRAGFSPSPVVLTITPAIAPTASDNDYTRINNAVQAAADGDTIKLLGTFNWTEANAAASWALGSDGLTGGSNSDDDYGITPPASLNNITITADNLGDATIQGPG